MSLVHGCCAFIIVFLVAACDQTNTRPSAPINPIANPRVPPMERIYDELTVLDAPIVAGYAAATYAGFYVNPDAPVGSCPTRLSVATARGTHDYRFDGSNLVIDTTIALPGKMRLATADLNGDGILDVIASEIEQDSLQPYVWLSSPDRSHAKAAVNLPSDRDGSSPYPFDIDGDGRLDLIIPEGYRCTRPFKILYQTATGAFEEDPDTVTGETVCNTGYAIWAGSLGDEPLVIAVLGGTESQPEESPRPGFFCKIGETSRGNPQFAPCLWEPKMHDGPDGYRSIKVPFIGCVSQGSPAPCVIDFNEFGNASFNRNAPMGFAVKSINAAGDLGFLVATDSLLISFAWVENTWVDVTRATGVPLLRAHEPGTPIPWGVAFVGPYLVVANGNDADERGRPRVGTQPISLYRDVGGGELEDVSITAGLGQMGQWQSLAVGDIDCDGRPDLAVGGQGKLPKIFRHRQMRDNWLSIALAGIVSDPLGMGATIRVEVDGREPQQLMVGSTGGPIGFSQPVVFAQLGSRDHARRVVVSWPSGEQTVITNLPAGFHVILEHEEIVP